MRLIAVSLLLSLFACERPAKEKCLSLESCVEYCKKKEDERKAREDESRERRMSFWKHGASGLCFASYSDDKCCWGTHVPCFEVKPSLLDERVESRPTTPEAPPEVKDAGP